MRISPAYLPLQVKLCHRSFWPPPGTTMSRRSTHVSPIKSVFLSSLKTEILSW